MQIIRSKKTIDRLNNHRFFNPSRLIAIAEKKYAEAKPAEPKKEIGKAERLRHQYFNDKNRDK